MPHAEQAESVFDGICDKPIDYAIGLVRGYKRSNELIPKLKQVVEWYERADHPMIKDSLAKPKEQTLSAEQVFQEVKTLSDYTRRSLLKEAMNKRFTKAVTYFRLFAILGDLKKIDERANFKSLYINSYKQSVSYDIRKLQNSDKSIPDALREAVHYDNIFVHELINERPQNQRTNERDRIQRIQRKFKR